MKVLIKSAKVIAPESTFHNKVVDILIDNGKISNISDVIEVSDDATVVEKENLHISPGWFDPTVSFGEPGYEENETLESGMAAAAAGGYTAVGLLPNTYPAIDKKSDVEFLIKRSTYNPVSIYPIGALSKKREGVEISEAYDMSNYGAIGFGDDKSIENEKLMEVALLYNKTIGKPVLSFPDTASMSNGGQMNEGESSTNLGLKGIPNLSEELRVSRDLFLTEYAEGKLHFQNVSTAKSVSLIKEAKKKGLDVTAQVAIHNIYLDDSVLNEFETRFKVMPPLRTKNEIKAIIKGIKDGVIDFVSSDHRPKDIERKFKEFDLASFGTIGLESGFGALNKVLSGKLELHEVISLICDKPRKRFGVDVPAVEIDAKAELTLFNPDESIAFDQSQIKSLSKNSAFVGKELKGRVYGVLSNDELVLN
ncbi:MAG: dihydroorotase [Bacteroidota bacterium]